MFILKGWGGGGFPGRDFARGWPEYALLLIRKREKGGLYFETWIIKEDYSKLLHKYIFC